MARRNLPSHKRSSTPLSMRLTERDVQVVLSVHAHRVLTGRQIEALHFASNSDETRTLRSVAQRRLQALYHNGFLDRIQRPVVLGEGRRSFAYALDKQGVDLTAAQLDIDRADVGWKPKDNRLGPLFLEHLIIINNVRIVMEILNHRGHFGDMEWIDEFTLKSVDYQNKMPEYHRSGGTTRVFPDGFFTVQTPNAQQTASFFLEVDRGTMQNSLWQRKVEAYRAFRDDGRSYRFFNTRNFRVLAVVNSRRRLQNLKRTTEKAGGTPFFWFTTQEQADVRQPDRFVEQVWQVAGQDETIPLF